MHITPMRGCNRSDQCEAKAMTRCRSASFATSKPFEQLSDVALNAWSIVSNYKANVVRANSLQRDRDCRIRRRVSQRVVEQIGEELL